MAIKQAIILAGGLGTRLRSVVLGLPKCMAPVAGRPFLFYDLEWKLLDGDLLCLPVGDYDLQDVIAGRQSIL